MQDSTGVAARLRALCRWAVVEIRTERPSGSGRYKTLDSWGKPSLMVARTASRRIATSCHSSTSLAVSATPPRSIHRRRLARCPRCRGRRCGLEHHRQGGRGRRRRGERNGPGHRRGQAAEHKPATEERRVASLAHRGPAGWRAPGPHARALVPSVGECCTLFASFLGSSSCAGAVVVLDTRTRLTCPWAKDGPKCNLLFGRMVGSYMA